MAKEPDARVTVLGGSLTRSADGRLQTLQTHGQYPSPHGVQEVWSNASQRRYPKPWDGEALPDLGYVIEWRPCEIACGNCGRSLGRYVAYHARAEWGVVEQTARRYEDNPANAQSPGSRNPRPRQRFRLEGEVGRRATKTTVHFRCPGCRREYQRNLSRLGRTLFDRIDDGSYLLE
jgi:hypothetical protein